MEQPSSQQMDIPSESIERELSSAPAEPILGLANDSAPSVMVVDSSAFSPAYDDSLCDALSKAGCRVTLASSQPHSPDFPAVFHLRSVEQVLSGSLRFHFPCCQADQGRRSLLWDEKVYFQVRSPAAEVSYIFSGCLFL